ncbi:MAG: RHS domain-containing protein [Neisseria sp.]|uniref:RHS domain-containing protein n=1 Tax=Neisseria sp. TaxID=192066 RepID=UPI0026DB3DD4|nr:RHS domain-containing protein [Neisseria sp.]MDO4641112.1 RHS domain-containing protein [Neisseria sp.]
MHQINLDGEIISDIERNRLHQEIKRSQGALTSLYEYDPMGRLKSQTATVNGTLQNNGKLAHLVGGAVKRSYRYDKAGNLIQSTDQRSGVLNYVYDKIGRIKEAGKERFAFDPANNILSENDKAHLSDRHLSGGNRLEQYNGIRYTYDALGNLIYRELPNKETQYFKYDTENQLVYASIKKRDGETQVWEYAYDPFGRRLSKERTDEGALSSTEPKRTHFVWDGSRLLQEYNYRGNYTYIYTDQDSYEPLAQIFVNNQDEKPYLSYFHNDQIGIPREMTDQFGNLLWFGQYTAWGGLQEETRAYPNAHQPFRLQNQYYLVKIYLYQFYNFKIKNIRSLF